jgi:hypothetical protein
VKIIQLVTEDRTGSGLEQFLKAEAQSRWSQAGKTQLLRFARGRGDVNGNARLLEQCEKYELFRFRYRPRVDHVFYIIDARNAWDLKKLGVQVPQRPYDQSLPVFIEAVRKRMAELARGPRTEPQWKDIEDGFHAHVLVWERESLILPVADRLRLGEAVRDVYDERQAFETVRERFRLFRRLGYSKSSEGISLLEEVARSKELREIVLASNPSLRAIVEDLTSL